MAKVAATAVERVLKIFEAFAADCRPLPLTELAERIEAPKSSCHAIVATLIAKGYLYSLNRPRALYPTHRMPDIAARIRENDPFLERAAPMLERLRDKTGETVILGKRQGDAVIYLDVVEGLHAIRYSAKVGEYKPLHSSATGKAILGSLREQDLRAWFEPRALAAVTVNTRTDPKLLVTEILDSRRRGYFVTRGENVDDVWAIATLVSLRSQVFSVAVAGPKHRMEPNLPEYAQLLVATCRVLSSQDLAGAPQQES